LLKSSNAMTLEDDVRTIRSAAAIGAVDDRRQIGVAGSDRASYLQGLLTNDITGLTAGSGCYAAWLTPQGRMHTDMHVLESGDMILLDVPAAEADATIARLDQYLFSEDVRLELLDGQLASIWMHGPSAAAVLATAVTEAAGADSWSSYHVSRGAWGASPVIVARIDQLGVPGYCLYVQPEAAAPLGDALHRAGAKPVSPEAIRACRIEAGYPVFGLDMTDDTIPLEAGIEDRAISFTKGCYVGQEVIIRVLHRGHGRVARRLVGLRVQEQVPPAGARIVAGQKDVGFVTSAAPSPALGPVALGYVHRDFVAPGTAVEVQSAAVRVPATVASRPMSVTAAGEPLPTSDS
jgi:folate-binding protein YgfZ